MNPVDHMPSRHDGQVDQFLVAPVLRHDQMLVGTQGLQLAQKLADHTPVRIANPAAQLAYQQALVLLDEARCRQGALRPTRAC